ncbi:unnamed protein product [Medioppia subpectinata]|uniref:Cytochrome P450 n=1 Tax=Medioppia subpectinata TaxID=1979941 RepID=A0A7R9LD77_9ACAR|nr:unnamed protein product [Medioppia subpectinata]CAG2117313.1 unnamed protein product [Medioppia subpectinata]
MFFLFPIIYWIYSNAFILLISLFTYFVSKQIYNEYEMRKKLPPGPLGLPFVGYLPFLKSEPSKVFVQLAKKYGPVFGIQLGSCPVVVLNDWPSIKEAFSDESALARPKDNLFTALLPPGFGTMSGDVWKEQRRFALHQLRNLGFGKTSMEDHIIDEINHLSKEIDKSIGQAFDLRTLLPISVSNNINSLTFGRRFDYTDPRKQMMDEFFKPDPSVNLAGILSFFPKLGGFVFRNLTFLLPSTLRNVRVRLEEIRTMMKTEHDNHAQTLDKNNNRDYFDAFINEMQKSSNGEKTTFNYDMLEGNTLLLFGAGSGTVLTTLEWSLVILAAYPQIQQHIQKEIDEVIGKERSPNFADRNQMPYLQAFMYEVWRFRTLTPINLPRYASKDMVISGFKIPKDTQIMANFWAIDNDPNLWENPSQFRPERLLSNDLKTFKKPEHLIPFSYGKRSCPGEILGVVETFLYLSSLLQKYDINANHKTDTSLEYEFQFSITPKQSPNISFAKRVHN